MIKSSVKTTQVKTKAALPLYPYLARYTFSGGKKQGSFIVLFSSKNTGVIVQADDGADSVGHYSCDRREEAFIPLNENEIVTLSNSRE